MTEAWTIKKLVDWTTDYFKKYSIEWPHLEAEILLAHALNVPRIQLYVQFERVLKEDELKSFKALILRRSKREPIAYITGYQPFMSVNIKVTPAVLVPRPETEKLVEVALEEAKQLKGPRVADIGVGSGAIAVCLAKFLPEARVFGTDLSKEAIEVAEGNAQAQGVADRCEFFVGDLFKPLEGQSFDIIVSNPPYIKTADIEKLQPEIKDFEPRGALDGGEDGLKFFKEIIAAAPPYLKTGGYLILEVGAGEDLEVSEMIKSSRKFEEPGSYKDLSGIKRVVKAKLLNIQ
jgi:release factor glutamine methyltransferase